MDYEEPVRVIVDPQQTLKSMLNDCGTTVSTETLIYHHDPELDGVTQMGHDTESSYSYEMDEEFAAVSWIGMAANNGKLSMKDLVRDLRFHQSLWHVLVVDPQAAKDCLDAPDMDIACRCCSRFPRRFDTNDPCWMTINPIASTAMSSSVVLTFRPPLGCACVCAIF